MSTSVKGFAPPGPKRCRSRGVRATMKGYVSKFQGKRTVNSKRKLLDKLLDAQIVTSVYKTYAEDLVCSTANSLGKKVNCAVVKDYALRLSSLNNYWSLVSADARLTYYGTTVGLNTLDMKLERKFQYRNTTNFNLYLYAKRCVAKNDVPDDRQPSQCWQHDLTNNTSGRFSFAADGNTEARSVYNLSTWLVGGADSEFDKYWRASAWESVIIPPGEQVTFNTLERVIMTKNEYDTFVTDDLIVFKKGMTALMVKVVAEKNITLRNGVTEDTNEASDIGPSFANIVEFLETCEQHITLRAYPGYAPTIVRPVSDVVAAAGAAQYGAILAADPTIWSNGRVYNETSGTWTAPTVAEDMTNVGTVESAAEQAYGVDEGLPGNYRAPMESA